MALRCNHRGVSPALFDILSDASNARGTPLGRFCAFDRNLLRKADFGEESVDSLSRPNAPWKVTKASMLLMTSAVTLFNSDMKCDPQVSPRWVMALTVSSQRLDAALD